MDTDQFEARIRRLEQQAAESPDLYRLRLGLLGTLGYGYLVLVILMVVVLVGLVVIAVSTFHSLPLLIFKFGWPLLVVPLIIVRAMWVRVPAPDGVEVDRTSAPRLHEMLDAVRVALRAPVVHHVLLSRDFNAGIVQVPRLGILGWPRNYLVLGMPMMLGLSPEAFRAVVAHEFGHLSENHGKFGAWIYSVRKCWAQVLIGIEEQEPRLDFGLRSFFRWYVPYFDSYSFVLARRQEYSADECAAEATTRQQACAALVEMSVMGSFLEQSVMPLIIAGADDDPKPPRTAFTDIQRKLAEGPPQQQAARSFAFALRVQTGYADTHPSLQDRLRSLEGNRALDLPTLEHRHRLSGAPVAVSAAAHFFGSDLDRWLDRFNTSWQEDVAQDWRHRHKVIQKQRDDLAQLDAAATTRDLNLEEGWKRLDLTLSVRGRDPALTLLREFIQAHPTLAPARIVLGRLLLDSDDENGISEIEEAMRIDTNCIPAGCEMIAGYLASRSRDAEIESWKERALRHYQKVESVRDQEELDVDSLGPHGMNADAVHALAEFLEQFPLRRALLVQDRLQNPPVFVLAISVRPRGGHQRSRDVEVSVCNSLQERLQGEGGFMVFVIEDNEAAVEAMERIEGSAIYPPKIAPR